MQSKKTFLNLWTTLILHSFAGKIWVAFEPVIDKISEISYIKKYYSPFDTTVSGFVNSNLLKQEIEETFQQHLVEVKYDNLFRNAKITAIKNQDKKECNSLEALEKKERKSKKRKLTNKTGECFQK